VRQPRPAAARPARSTAAITAPAPKRPAKAASAGDDWEEF
jgi:hypothetical protein